MRFFFEGILAEETRSGREAARDFLLQIYHLRDELLCQKGCVRCGAAVCDQESIPLYRRGPMILKA